MQAQWSQRAAFPKRLSFEALEQRLALTGDVHAEPDHYRIEQGSVLQPRSAPEAGSQQAYVAHFDSTSLPPEFNGAGQIVRVGGYANLGTPANHFSGNFLRNATGMAHAQGNVPYSTAIPTRLTLENLPPHTSIDLRFLLAVIDSWDGESEPGVEGRADVFGVTVDGRQVFADSFDNLDAADQSFVPLAGVSLAERTPLGFNPDFVDSAYDLGQDPRFNRVPHDSPTLTIEWFSYGNGWTAEWQQNESWAIDNVEVILNGVPSAPWGVLANDLDANGAPLSARLFDRPRHGSLTFRSDGTFTYTPTSSFVGADSFSYRARTADAESPLTVVQIDVYAKTNVPNAIDDAFVATRGSALQSTPERVVKDLSTGLDEDSSAKVADGQLDLDYRLVDAASSIPFRNGSAVSIASPGAEMLPDESSDNSRWITGPTAPHPCAFETTVDLTGYLPSTAWISGLRVVATGAIASIWVDEVPILTERIEGGRYFHDLVGLGRGAFHPGLNRVRFVIDPLPAGESLLRVEGRVEAQPADGAQRLIVNDFLPPPEHSPGLLSVPATADPWLAGMPTGSQASDGDVAPQQSPVEVRNVLLRAGDVLRFAVEGAASNSPFVTLFPLVDPDGGDLSQAGQFVRHAKGAENGISDIVAPFNSLVGVFLSDAAPNASVPPGALDFSPAGNVPGGIEYRRLTPALKQVFFVGDGFTSEGHRQEIVVPTGATRLFLGTMDGYGWYNNLGRFDVRVHSTQFSVAEDVAAVLVRSTTHGSLALSSDGSFGYQPDRGFQGDDSFRYRLETATGLRSNVATVLIRVDPIPGDVNGDARVDLADFAILKRNFGKSGDRNEGDLDGDGIVGLNDFALLKQNFGQLAEVRVPAESRGA